MQEDYVKTVIREYLKNQPSITSIGTEFCPAKNCCVTDLIGYEGKKIRYLVECKGSGAPGVIAGGIGQACQYYYQKLYSKSIDKKAKILFACPYDMKKFLDLMKIPKEINQILLVKEDGIITFYKETKSKKIVNQIQLPGTSYIEGLDLNLFKKVLILLFKLKREDKNRKRFGEIMHKIVPTFSEDTHRKNTLVPLRDMGVVERFDLTPHGYYLYGVLKRSEKEFNQLMISKFYPFVINILNAIIQFARDTKQDLSCVKFNNKEIEKKIVETYGAEVRFFDYRRLTYGIKLLVDIGALVPCKKGYKISKITNF